MSVFCDKCGKRMKYDESLGFGAGIDNNRYRKCLGLDDLGMSEHDRFILLFTGFENECVIIDKVERKKIWINKC